MQIKYGFTKMNIVEFKQWLKDIKVGRTILYLQHHHTYIPNYQHFTDDNHFRLQRGMKRTHVHTNGWWDIGQHFTTFPDGSIVTGRSLELSPACIYRNNGDAICIENLGNFDMGEDNMTAAQRKTIIEMTAAICMRFDIPVDTHKIVYHHWFHLSTGERNNGTGGNKSCPGTGFLGGNKVANCEANLLSHVRPIVQGAHLPPPPKPLKYAVVVADELNVRGGTSVRFPKVSRPVNLGGIIRVYAERNGWYKISNSSEYWVSAKYADDVKRATVTVPVNDVLNVRSGPSAVYTKEGALPNGQEIFVEDEFENWAKLVMEDKWVSKRYLKFGTDAGVIA